MNLIAVAALGFIVGAIPFGYLLVRMVASEDIRDSGSGNIGATNVGRRLGKGAWALTLLLDMAKGLFPVLAGAEVAGTVGAAAAAFGAVAGHCYSPFLGGLGGKGVATMLGGVLGLNLPVAAITAAIIVVVAIGTRFMSVGSIAGAVALPPLFGWFGGPREQVAAAIGIAIIVVWRHRTNMQRILGGEEERIGRTSS